MNNKSEVLGLFLGGVQGFILAKVYQIWAILYWGEGLRIAGKVEYNNAAIWVFSIENPTLFLFIVVVIFAAIGYLIQKTYYNIKK